MTSNLFRYEGEQLGDTLPALIAQGMAQKRKDKLLQAEQDLKRQQIEGQESYRQYQQDLMRQEFEKNEANKPLAQKQRELELRRANMQIQDLDGYYGRQEQPGSGGERKYESPQQYYSDSGEGPVYSDRGQQTAPVNSDDIARRNFAEAAKREYLMGRSTDFKQFTDGEGRVMAYVRGVPTFTGERVLTEEQKADQKASSESRKKYTQEKTIELSANNRLLEHANIIMDMLKEPIAKEALSDVSNDTARAISNFTIKSSPKKDIQDFRKRFDTASNLFVQDYAKTYGGNMTNAQLRNIQATKPNLNMSRTQSLAAIKTSIDFIKSNSDRAKKELEYVKQGYDPSEAALMASEQSGEQRNPEPENRAPINYENAAIEENTERQSPRKGYDSRSYISQALGENPKSENIIQKAINNVGEMSLQALLGGADAFGGMLDSAVNLVPEGIEALTGADLGRFRHTDLRDKNAEGWTKTAQDAGSIAGTLGAATLGAQFLPNTGKAASSLMGKGTLRDLIAAGLEGATSGGAAGLVFGEGNRAESTGTGAILGGALGTGAEAVSKIANAVNPLKITKAMNNQYIAEKTKYGTQISNAIKEADSLGISLTPSGTDKLAPGRMSTVSSPTSIEHLMNNNQKEAARIIEKFNNQGTFQAGKEAVSILGEAASKIKRASEGKIDRASSEIIKKARSSILEKMEQGMKSAKRPELWKMYENGRAGYEKEVVPFLNNHHFQEFSEQLRKTGGKVDAAEARKLISDLSSDPTFLREIGETGKKISESQFIKKHGITLAQLLATAGISASGVLAYQYANSLPDLQKMTQ